MTPDQASEFERVLEAIEEWMMAMMGKARADELKHCREELVIAVDDLMSALELDEDEHGGLGRGGRQ
jgi:hypothetical protein